MGLTETQACLARLYTDAEFRERFFETPVPVGAEQGLTPEEAGQLHEAAAQIDYFARSLVWKRRQDVEKLLPHTRQALGERFASLFHQHARHFVPAGIHKPREDAIAFALFLRRSPESVLGSWVDLALYEADRLAVSQSECRVRVRWFRYPMRSLLQRARERQDLTPVAPRWSVAVWLRGPSGRRWHFVW